MATKITPPWLLTTVLSLLKRFFSKILKVFLHFSLPGTVQILALKVPSPGKPQSPGKLGGLDKLFPSPDWRVPSGQPTTHPSTEDGKKDAPAID